MKRYNGKFLAIQIIVILLLSCGITAGLVFPAITHNNTEVLDFIGFVVLIGFIIAIIWTIIYRFVSENIAKKTLATADDKGIHNSGTFITNREMLRIDAQTGKIAYVAYQNPYELQIVSAADITDIQTWWNKAPFNATSYVAFQFNYKGKRIRIPTFTSSRSTYSMNSNMVKTAITKADTYVNLLTQARQAAMSVSGTVQ